MLTSFTLLILSLVALYFGADRLVKGSSSLALRAKISPLVVGLTVVAFGTSAPELVVSISSVLNGQGDIAIGNIVGSNIFNICIILGIAAMIYPLQTKKQLIRIDIPLMILTSLVFVLFFWSGHLERWQGGLFVLGIISYLVFSFHMSRKEQKEKEELQEQLPLWYINLSNIVIGLVILVLGSQLLVDNATIIARSMGVSEAVIGLTIVAAGTSMPELATSVVAALKKNPEIALGNAVGSNIFNILAIAGITSLIHPIEALSVNYIDLLVMLAVSLILLPLAWSRYRLSRGEGLFLVVSYIGYTLWLLRDLI